jgi:HEAT repeat protein
LVHIDCTEALTVLGPDAAPAVPALIEALRDSGSASHWTIIRTLRQLPFKPEELDPFLEDLRRKGEFTNALRDVADLGVRTPAAARLLGAALSTADPATRRSAASQFANFGPNAVVALPALTAALSDQDQGVRYESANALESLGTNALPAVPALMQATNDASVMVQRAAARALQKIGAKPAEETLRSPSAR